jgi:hypothetical protein
MQKFFRCLVFAVAGLSAATATAGELIVKIADGRATVIAKDVTVRQILAEWARVGDTRMVNGEKVAGGPISLELVDVPEKDALDILLRTAAGYVTGPRPAGAAGASLYDRVMILATSRAPAPTAAAAPTPFNPRQALQQIQQPPPDDDDGEPLDQGPVPPPGMQPFPGPNDPNQNAPFAGQGVPFPGPTPGIQNPNADPNANPNVPAQQLPVTSPRPGLLPQQPQPTPINPYSPMGRPTNPNGRGGNPNNPNDPNFGRIPDDQGAV